MYYYYRYNAFTNRGKGGEIIENEEIFKWINLYDKDSIEFRVIDNVAEITYEKNKDINKIEDLGAQIKKVTSYDDTKVVKVIYWVI